jgi:hypothetical protein
MSANVGEHKNDSVNDEYRKQNPWSGYVSEARIACLADLEVCIFIFCSRRGEPENRDETRPQG